MPSFHFFENDKVLTHFAGFPMPDVWVQISPAVRQRRAGPLSAGADAESGCHGHAPTVSLQTDGANVWSFSVLFSCFISCVLRAPLFLCSFLGNLFCFLSDIHKHTHTNYFDLTWSGAGCLGNPRQTQTDQEPQAEESTDGSGVPVRHNIFLFGIMF